MRYGKRRPSPCWQRASQVECVSDPLRTKDRPTEPAGLHSFTTCQANAIKSAQKGSQLKLPRVPLAASAADRLSAAVVISRGTVVPVVGGIAVAVGGVVAVSGWIAIAVIAVAVRTSDRRSDEGARGKSEAEAAPAAPTPPLHGFHHWSGRIAQCERGAERHRIGRAGK